MKKCLLKTILIDSLRFLIFIKQLSSSHDFIRELIASLSKICHVYKSCKLMLSQKSIKLLYHFFFLKMFTVKTLKFQQHEYWKYRRTIRYRQIIGIARVASSDGPIAEIRRFSTRFIHSMVFSPYVCTQGH